MIRYAHQGRRTSRRKPPFYQDQFFRLPTVLAVNDPFLNRVYGVVSYYLDDHPYPDTPEDFRRRTEEIKQNIQTLQLSPEQHKFLDRLMSETGVTLVDLWQGSHVIALDNGFLYDTWSKSSVARPRFSSHYNSVPLQQYGFYFLDHQLLFGKTDLNGNTWFQMEAHGFEPANIYNDPNAALYHGQDFIKYRLHRMNVGPFGFSPHTEMEDPIILSYKPLETRKIRNRKANLSNRISRLSLRMKMNLIEHW